MPKIRTTSGTYSTRLTALLAPVVAGRTLETDVKMVVVVRLVAHEAAARAAPLGILEKPIQVALVDAAVERPLVQDSLNVVIQEDRLHAARVVGRARERDEQVPRRRLVQVPIRRAHERVGIPRRLLL